MALHVSVDFGTSSTCTVVSVDGGEPQVVVIDGQPLVPSAVYAAEDGTLFVGHEAERQAAVDPSRFEPHPKRRIDEGELLLGTSVLKVGDVVRAVLHRAVGEARRYAGGAAVDLLVLTHPADWGSTRVNELRRAAARLAHELVLVPEPVAAAVFHSAGHGMPEGGVLAVLDLGGGTVDASAVRKQGRSFEVLAARGDPNFGGADIDQALLEHAGSIVAKADPEAWRRLVDGRDMADRRRRRVLRQDVRGAKETLSRHTYTDVPMPSPFSDAHVTRADLERLIGEPLAKAAELVLATLHDGGVAPQQLAGVFLVGGSSRIPMVSRLIHERTGVVPTTLDQPETVVARGALRAVRLDPDRTGGVQPTSHYGAVRAGAPSAAPNVRRPPTPPPPAVANDSLSQASTIVIGASDQTRKVQPAPRRSRRVVPWLIGGGALAVVAVLVLVLVFVWPGTLRGTAASQHVSAYRYGFDYPPDWQQIGGDSEKWQTLIGPRPSGRDRIAVQQGLLDYDAGAGRARAVRDLRQQYESQIAEGKNFSDLNEETRFAGRDVISYREHVSGTTVDWYVLHQGRSRVQIGCQYTESGREEVLRACRQVVRSLEFS